jgi:NADH-quinone oxidoreductase subunit J
MEIAVFSLFALLALVSAVVVVTHRNPVYSTMSLVVTLFSLAVLFVMLGAPFIGTLQVLVYTGAILVLFLFVIMLLNVAREEKSESSGGPQQLFAMLTAAVFIGTLGRLLWLSSASVRLTALTAEQVSLKGLASELFERYLLAFEMVGLLLLVAVVAASVLARRLRSPADNDAPPRHFLPEQDAAGETRLEGDSA